jgi:outer membrane protein
MRALALLVLCSTVGLAQVPAALTLDDALRLAHEQHPQLKVARAQVAVAKARTGEAFAGLLPQISASLGYSRSTSNFVARPGSLPSSVSSTSSLSLQSYDFFTSGLTVNQLIWDFGTTWYQSEASKASLDAQQATARASNVTVDLTVRSAYFGAAAQKQLVQVAEATLANTEAHLAQVEGFVKVGTRPEIDLAQSRVDRANARLSLVNARNAYSSGKAKLNQAMGVEAPTSYEVVDGAPGPGELEGQSLEDLVVLAASARPELAALEAQLHAQELSLRAVKGNFWPQLNASLGLTVQARALPQPTPNLNFGLNLQWAFYQGGLTLSQVSENEATLAQLSAQRDTSHHQVRLDVEQALLDVNGGKESVEVAEEVLAAAKEQLRLAEGRYNAGAGSSLELSDAQVKLTQAAAQKVQAVFTLASARARLLAATGK